MKYVATVGVMFLLLVHHGVYVQDAFRHQAENNNLKNVASRASLAAGLYLETDAFGHGEIVFNQAEGIKAAEAIIQSNLALDNHFTPLERSYWQETVTYEIYFFDTSNTSFPHRFTHGATGYSKLLVAPTVIVSINGGKADYRLMEVDSDQIRTSSYEYKAHKI